MTPAAILKATAADGVLLSLSAAGAIKAAGDQAAVTRWLPVIREHKPDIVSILAGVAYRWRLLFSDREPLTVAFSPEASHAEVLSFYPDALAAEPCAPTVLSAASAATEDEKRAILRWLDSIGEHDSVIVGETTDVCRRDPDDRRLCTQCSNLRGAICSVSKPGGVVSAIIGYRPALDLPHRCAGYSPNADQSAGRESWPASASVTL